MKFALTIITFLSLTITNSEAQIGNFLKERAKDALKSERLKDLARDKVTGELEEMRAEYDSSSFNYAISLNDNAGLFESKERFERQQKFLLDYLNRQDGELTEEETARGWVDRAELLYANGKYKLAMGLLIGAKAIYESESKTKSIDYARTISNISLVSHSLGRLSYAEEYGEMALEMRERLFGENSNGYAASLNNVALIKKDLGYYNLAQEMLEKAVVKNREIVGAESMGHAISLNNLAALNQLLGRYKEAEPLFKQAIQIAEVHLKEKSGNFQRLQTNLALLYKDMGRYDEAEAIYLEAISLKKKRFGESHPDYAHLLNNLAALYMDMGKYEDVEKLLLQSVEIYEDKLGDDSPATASAKSDLGHYYLYQGEYMKALNQYKAAKNARVNELGPKHPATTQSIEDEALARWKLGEVDKAIELYDQVWEHTYEAIDEYFLPMSEHEKARFWSKLKPRLFRFYSFVTDAGESHPSLVTQTVELQAATKAMLMNSTNKIKNEILNGENEELKSKYSNWIDQKEMLAHYYTYSKEELAEEKINLDSLESEANQSERYLSEHSEAMRNQLTQQRKTWKEIASSLDGDERLVEIIHTRKFENHLTNEFRYMVLTLSKTAPPTVVTLENGDQLDSRYFKYYTNVTHNKLDDAYSYDQYWKAVDKRLTGVKKVFVSPDGVFNQININTLRKPDGRFILESYDITLVSNPADIIDIKSGAKKTITPQATLVGYPIYGGDGSIALLPGTRKEVENIQSTLKKKNYTTRKVMNEEATEAGIKELRPMGILHIATHGFFMKNTERKSSVFGISTESASDNPLIRSGLLFTGAGDFMAGGNAQSDLQGSNDGVLTSFEAMSMPLDQTDLVVLSACETGLGEVESGEGVYGLQRALTVAGASHLIMSLWKVDDQATQQLMTLFYNKIVNGQEIGTAFRNAQLELKKTYPSPYYWGAFIHVSH